MFEEEEPSELLQIQKVLVEEATNLLNISGLAWAECGNLARHLSFLDYYLTKNDKLGCGGDTKDILFLDLPATLRSILAKSSDDQHFDEELKSRVLPIVHDGHYDSAIRKVFILLSDRLRRAFGVEENIDGEDLINLVFGKKGGKIPVALDESKKTALRNLISGFYGVYRNRFAHHDVEPDLAQTRMIIEMANTIILDIEVIASDSVRKA